MAVAKNAGHREEAPCTVDSLRVAVFGLSLVMQGMLPAAGWPPILLVGHVWLIAMLADMETILPLIVTCLDDGEGDIDRQKLDLSGDRQA